MSVSAALALTPLVVQAVEMGLTVAPSVIAAVKTELDLANAKAAPDAAQMKQIMDALDQANAALEAAKQPGA
jgi:hypothetical protein